MISEAEIRGLKDSMSELIGRDLSSVEFVQDYMQFHFDGSHLSTLTLPSVRTEFGILILGQLGYRDALCELIGKNVTAVSVTSEELSVFFNNGESITVSLRDNDYRGPEAINYIAANGEWTVV